MKPQVVLSLFDGMSCGQIAFERLGIPIKTYYASEIDPYPIKVTQANYPDTVQLGDVRDISLKSLPEKPDIILAGSPCTGFSFAGKRLAFDDPQSVLFFEFVRLLKEIEPKWFLLENVKMKKEYLNVITEHVGVEPILLNSALVSAQNRWRYYWTNIPGINEPEDRGIVLRDILETDPDNFTLMSSKFVTRQKDRKCLIGNEQEKAKTFSAMEYIKNGRQGDYIACDEDGNTKQMDEYKGVPYNYFKDDSSRFNKPIKVGMNVEKVKVRKHEVNISGLQKLLREMKSQSGKTNKQIANETNMPVTKVEHWFRTDSSFAIPSDDIWHKLKEVLGIKTDVFDKEIMEFIYRDGVFETTQRVYSDQGKSPTLTATNKEQMIETKPRRVGTAAEINGHDYLKRVYSPDGKSPTLTTCAGGNTEPKVAIYQKPRGTNKGGIRAKDGKTPSLTSSSWQENNLLVKAGAIRGRYNGDGTTYQKLEIKDDGKSNTLTTVEKDNVLVDSEMRWRKLTPIEAERLQTVDDNYTAHVSNSRRYHMLGNGWTIEIICHILKNMVIVEQGGEVEERKGQIGFEF